MDMTAIQAMVASLKVATDIVKGLFELKDTSEVQTKILALQGALMSAQNGALAATTAQFELQEQVRELEAKLKGMDDWEKEKARYALFNPWRGPAQVYALKQDEANGEQPHYLCTNCFHNRKRVILAPLNDKNGFILMSCPACKATVATGYRGIGAAKYAGAINEG